MGQIDPRLQFLQRHGADEKLAKRTASRLGLSTDATQGPAVHVLVRLAPEAGTEALEAAGMQIRESITGPFHIVSGKAPLAAIALLEKLGVVESIEAARSLQPEDLCVPNVHADAVHRDPGHIRGKGALIGVIDSGIDYRHPDFRDQNGSRVRSIWDQNARPGPNGGVPYGREYSRKEIEAAIDGSAAAGDIPADDDDKGHGTHVAGIAAGGGKADPKCVGLAPEAELIIVALNRSDGVSLGRSNYVVDALNYLVRKAAGTPIAINLSRGMNGGGHSGETIVEQAIDNLARLPDVAVVKSAGNEQVWRIHAGGTMAGSRTRELRFKVPTNDLLDDVIEVWFDDQDDISALQPPGAPAMRFVRRGGSFEARTPAGNLMRIVVKGNAEETGDTAATIILSSGTASMIQPGTWSLKLKGGRVKVGRFDAWIERAIVEVDADRPSEQTQFLESSNDPTRTITTPGTARNVITVGSYVTRPRDASSGTPAGALSLFSSQGPTRYGAIRPDLAAPGEMISAAKVGSSTTVLKAGTSMSTPVVTGAAALIMSQQRGLKSHQLRQILTRTARSEGAASTAPDNAWGYGMLDVEAAVELASATRFPVIGSIKVTGSKISWRTDIETTGAVRFLNNRRQLLLGRNPASLADLQPAKSHVVDLGGNPPGTYFCEIVAFSRENFYTEDDKDGRCHVVKVAKKRARPKKSRGAKKPVSRKTRR